MSDAWISESKLAAGLMPSETLRDRIRELRQEHLFEGEHFRIHKKEVQYSSEGVERLMELLHLDIATEASTSRQELEGHDDMAQGKKTAPATNAPTPARVHRVWQNNPHYLEATMDGVTITICCRQTKNFVTGMEIARGLLARRGEGHIYDFVGQCPRGRGAW